MWLYHIVADLLLFISGVLVGILFVIFRLAKNLPKVFISPITKGNKANFVRMEPEDTGKEIIYANPESFKQSLELLISLISWRFKFNKEHVVLGNEKRQQKIFYTFTTVCILAILWGVFLIFNVQT